MNPRARAELFTIDASSVPAMLRKTATGEEFELSPLALAVIEACDGSRSPGEIATSVAAAHQAPVADAWAVFDFLADQRILGARATPPGGASSLSRRLIVRGAAAGIVGIAAGAFTGADSVLAFPKKKTGTEVERKEANAKESVLEAVRIAREAEERQKVKDAKEVNRKEQQEQSKDSEQTSKEEKAKLKQEKAAEQNTKEQNQKNAAQEPKESKAKEKEQKDGTEQRSKESQQKSTEQTQKEKTAKEQDRKGGQTEQRAKEESQKNSEQTQKESKGKESSTKASTEERAKEEAAKSP